MQTFLPYADFQQTAACLDYKRLGKQRVEARQILKAILYGGGWKNHPAVNMWRGYEDALIIYGNVIILEWIKRGYKNSMPLMEAKTAQPSFPWWLGNNRFHSSHRSNLLRKNFDYYKQFNWEETPDLSYWYPREKE